MTDKPRICPFSIGEALQFARQQLAASATAVIDSDELLCHVLQCRTVTLLSRPEQLLSEAQQTQFIRLVEARKNGQPVAHLTGQRGFWTLDLQVTADTLIPRPDSELLVSLALDRLQPGMRLLDLGTGSGALALAVASERPDVSVVASDYSAAALLVARGNAERLGLQQVQFIHSNWLSAFANQQFDLIVCNPPYIEQDDPHLLSGDLRFEPRSALAAGVDGLDDLRLITQQARQALHAGGWLLCEHGYNQSMAVQQLFAAAGFVEVAVHQDFGGRDRVVMGQLPL